VLDLLRVLPDGAVLCSHGDVIPDTIDALLRRGTVVAGQPDWRKGSTWILEREGGEIVRATAEPPPTSARDA
jgi:8-oxo-dGTP diphosphatase